MYRIRLTTGEEAVYKTVEELAQAVASGVVSPNAEVFHKAGNRWLPINTHPDYRAVTPAKRHVQSRSSAPHSAPAGDLSPADQRPTPLSLAAVEVPAPAPVDAYRVRPVEEPIPQAEADPAPPEPAIPEEEPEPGYQATHAAPKRGLRPVLIGALGLVGLLLIAGGVALSSRLAGRATVREAPSEQVEGIAPAPASAPGPAESSEPEQRSSPAIRLARPDTVTVEYPAPSKPLPPAAARPAPAVPPRVVSRLGTTVTRMPSYFEAYADARAEMDESLNYVNFWRVFAPYRFTSLDSLRATRRLVAAAGNILRVYRGQEVMLEQTYRPGEPDGHGSLRESFEVAEASRSLLADVDSLLTILVAQEGEVRYRDGAMYFQNRSAARAYTDMRRRIDLALTGLGDVPEAADRVTMPRLLRAIGSDRPPPAR